LKEKLKEAAKKAGAVNKLGAIAKALSASGLDAGPKGPEGPSMGGIAGLLAARAKANVESIEEEDTGIPLKDDPGFAKYFKMLKMGLSIDAVKNTLKRDGKDSAILDLDPEKSLEFHLKLKNSIIKIKEGASPPLGGTAAMAAAAATARNLQGDPAVEEILRPGPIGGIAEMAAATASRRNTAGEPESGEQDTASGQRGFLASNVDGLANLEATTAIKLHGSKAISASVKTASGDSAVLHNLAGFAMGQMPSNSAVGMAGATPVVGGGIAAMAATAAFKRNNESNPAPTGDPLGNMAETNQRLGEGITAAVNQGQSFLHRDDDQLEDVVMMNSVADGVMVSPESAAASKQNHSNVLASKAESRPMIPFAGGGIAAAAAAAAAKRNQVKVIETMDSVEKKPATNPLAGGGIAAAAAGAAAEGNNAKNAYVSEAELLPMSPFAGGEIAAAAAAAAAKRNHVNAPEEVNSIDKKPVTNPFAGGGIAAAAAAAAAAAKRNNAKNASASEAESPPMSPFAGAGIAAAAAAAAAKRNQVKAIETMDSVEEKPATNPLAGGGIAAAAAGAAAERNNAKNASVSEAESSPMSPFAGAGIAAAAAAAAAKRNQANASEEINSVEAKPATNPFTGGGIGAAAAAAAAAKRNNARNASAREAESPPMNPFAGIAAAAAAAAAKRNQANKPEEINSVEEKPATNPFAGSGIGAVAAVAAAAKRNNAKNTSAREAESPPMNPFAGAGIAAAAAAAAAQRNQVNAIAREETESVEEKPATNPFAGGGIGAAAAAAAAKRNIAKNAFASEAESPPMNPFAGGGIAAAAAAAAAAKRSQVNVPETMDSVDEKQATNPFAGGGIGAAAATFAANRNNAKNASASEAESPSMSPFAGGGIAAAAAAAAAKRSQSQVSDRPDEKPPIYPFAGGGIVDVAAMRNARALEAESSTTNQISGDVIAAGAAPKGYQVNASERGEIVKPADGKSESCPFSFDGDARANNTATDDSDDESLSMNPLAINAGGDISAAAEAAAFKLNEVQIFQASMSQTSIRYMAKTSSMARQIAVSTHAVEEDTSDNDDLVVK